MANTKRIAVGIVVALCALAVTTVDGAATKRDGNNKNSETDQREEQKGSDLNAANLRLI